MSALFSNMPALFPRCHFSNSEQLKYLDKTFQVLGDALIGSSYSLLSPTKAEEKQGRTARHRLTVKEK